MGDSNLSEQMTNRNSGPSKEEKKIEDSEKCEFVLRISYQIGVGVTGVTRLGMVPCQSNIISGETFIEIKEEMENAPLDNANNVFNNTSGNMFRHNGRNNESSTPLGRKKADIRITNSFSLKKNGDKNNKSNIKKIKAKKIYQCTICERISANSSDFSKHKVTHNPERTVQCPVCKTFLKSKDCLRNHMMIHNNRKPHQCKLCFKFFRQAGQVVRHIRHIHTGEMPYMCKFCMKRFHTNSGLCRHIRIHSPQPKYTCHVCGRGFNQNNNLKGHLRTHTKERPFKCDICQKGFNFKHSLKAHRCLCTGR